ncbi:MAG: DUF4178 domain-containing protein, partial [Rhizobacter sp.]|nr:DUF4178 domain-containing protein [Rhizobacter sp.]
NTQGEVGTLDYSDPAATSWSVGRAVALSELSMTGLVVSSERTLSARGVECPSCGAALTVKLASTQSIVCHQCHAVVDVSQGVGGDLKHYAQGRGREPQIPLGSIGRLSLGEKRVLPWQVVGYAERCEVPEDEGDDASCWREYLLYHRGVGFAFLVDSEDGWSWAVPITGVPKKVGDNMRHQGDLYAKLYSYTGTVRYVLGEFYWKLSRDERTANTDYQGTHRNAHKRLNREQTGAGDSAEVVWSAGETLQADVVAKAFNLAPEQRAALQRDASPTSFKTMSPMAKLLLVAFIIFFVIMIERCDNPGDNCDTLRATYGEASQEYRSCLATHRSSRTSGGSFGGFSSGGGHK